MLFNFVSLLLYLNYKTTPQNKHHLTYLKIHITFIILILSLFCAVRSEWIPEASLKLMWGLGILSLPFLLLHIKSALTGTKARMHVWYFIPLLLYFLLCVFNYYEINFLNSSNVKILPNGLNLSGSVHYSDVILMGALNVAIFVPIIFLEFKKNITQSKQITRKKAYSFWLCSYLIFILLNTIASNLYYFDFYSPAYRSAVIKVINITHSLRPIAFLLNPSLLYYIPVISKYSGIILKKNTQPFRIVEDLMQKEQLFLDQNLTLQQVCTKTGIYQQKITTIIKENTNNNWKNYVNSYRIDYALRLLHNNYLKKHSVKALGEESGFNSNQSFFRAFKTKMDTTPAIYYKNFLKEDIEA
jgi:AraC-like DNA-binding protein